MVSRLRSLGLLVLLVAPCACTRVWYTHPMREAFEAGHGAPPSERVGAPQSILPDRLQYFVSSRIVLERRLRSRDERVEGGHVSLRRGEWIERLIVRRGTPGVATGWDDRTLRVSFEPGGALEFVRDQALPAALARDREPAGLTGWAAPRETYLLRTDRSEDGIHRLDYRGQRWEVVQGFEGARLEVRRDDRRRWGFERRVVRGRRLD
ncbi:MAG: hypothetical protein IAG13_27790 [Deltaproteobacteria bacterium]|nr:hypothetical protein [Nannocystaceae bacterium]